MSFDQTASLLVLFAVVAALIWGRIRSDVVALTGAAALLALGTIRPVEAQAAFASPALIALASLFVIAYALELSGLMDAIIAKAAVLCRRLGEAGLWVVILMAGLASAFLNNTPIVVLAAPVVRDVAIEIGASPKRFLIPLSYVTILGGGCTLIGTSTNLLVNDMARAAGQPTFGLFEVTPVAVLVAIAGGLYLFLVGGRTLSGHPNVSAEPGKADIGVVAAIADAEGNPGRASVFLPKRPLDRKNALIAALVFVGVVSTAAMGWAPIAAGAFTGAVVLILTRVISADQAYQGLRPDILLLVAGMVVIGLSLQVSGLASLATDSLVGRLRGVGPTIGLILLYGATLFLTELLSNAAVAVLVTPVAVAFAESLGVNPRPFLVAVMLAASAAFATPFGYQTNVLVFQMGRYSYADFLKVGLPLNLITWVVGVVAIPYFFPF